MSTYAVKSHLTNKGNWTFIPRCYRKQSKVKNKWVISMSFVEISWLNYLPKTDFQIESFQLNKSLPTFHLFPLLLWPNIRLNVFDKAEKVLRSASVLFRVEKSGPTFWKQNHDWGPPIKLLSFHDVFSTLVRLCVIISVLNIGLFE